MSAWSYTTGSVTKTSVQSKSDGGRITCDEFMIVGNLDRDDYWTKGLAVYFIKPGCVITSVEFAMKSGTIDQCEYANWEFDASTGKWVQDGTFAYYQTIPFSSSGDCQISSVTITYHKHNTLTHHDAVPAKCTETGMNEYWECSDCGHIYLDEAGKQETDMASLVIAATNHKDCMTFVPEVPATCDEEGKQSYWHCSACGGNFSDKEGTTAITNVTIPAINHKNKKFNEAVAPTAETTGNVAYWHCPDCNKNFEDEACTKEIAGTDYELEKLMNMMHLDFAGTSTPIETEHYLNATKFNFTDDGDIILTVNGESVTYDKGMIDKFTLSNGTPGVKLSANEDPDNKGTYYSTFYSRLESYAVPEGFTAYRGEISDDGTKLTLTSVEDDVMSRGEGYILRGTASSGNMNVTENADGGSTGNVLLGTDVATTLSTNDYALSLGQYGVGFYLWNGKSIGANKAYLTLDGSVGAKAFTFEFENGETTGILKPVMDEKTDGPAYNLNGIRVNDHHKGVVIKNGKKVLVK